MSLQIRKATIDDLPAVHQLVRELAIYEKAEHEFTATIDDYRKDFEANIYDAIIAILDDEVVGMVLYYMTYSTWKGRMLYLEDFVVKEAHRRHGIGQHLFEALQEDAQKRDCRMMKWQVLDWNEPAIQFYKKNQAIIEKEWWNGKLFFV
jgi:GNAT superfamily N-acetyltransferase